MPTLVSATPNYVRPQRCIPCGGEAGRHSYTLFKRPASSPGAVAAASLTDIYKLSPIGGGGFVGRSPCASDQWFIRFRMRQWLTTWTSLSYSFTPRLPSLAAPILLVCLSAVSAFKLCCPPLASAPVGVCVVSCSSRRTCICAAGVPLDKPRHSLRSARSSPLPAEANTTTTTRALFKGSLDDSRRDRSCAYTWRSRADVLISTMLRHSCAHVHCCRCHWQVAGLRLRTGPLLAAPCFLSL